MHNDDRRGGKPFEVTTLREDVETYGRAAKVRSAAISNKTRCAETSRQRAVAVAGRRLHDYTGGQADLKRRKIRFIGDPATRIARIICASALFSLPCGHWRRSARPAGLHAAILARESLSLLSRERIRAELLNF